MTLHPDLLEDGVISREAIRAFMREGRDPFLPGVQPLQPAEAEPESEPVPASPPPTTLAEAMQVHAAADDVEGITRLLETWPVRDEEWSVAVAWRVCTESTSAAQRDRLLALGARLKGVVIDSAPVAVRQLSRHLR